MYGRGVGQIYVEGETPFQSAGLRGLGQIYVEGEQPFRQAGLSGFLDDVVGGFSGQTVLLVAGVGLLLFLMTSKATKGFEVGASKLRARDSAARAKRRVDAKLGDALKAFDSGDYSTGHDTAKELATLADTF